jgi:hypothetical protein
MVMPPEPPKRKSKDFEPKEWQKREQKFRKNKTNRFKLALQLSDHYNVYYLNQLSTSQ